MRARKALKRLRDISQRGRGEALILAAARVVSASCVLGIAVASARQLGPSARGEIVLVVTVTVLATELVSLGSDTSGRIMILRRSGIGVEDLLGLIAVLTLVQGAVVGVVLLVIEQVLGLLGASLIPVGVFLGMSVFQARMLTGAGFAIQRPLAVAARDTLGGLLPLVAVFFLAIDGRLSVQNVVGLTGLGYAIGSAYLWTVVLRHCNGFRLLPRNWRPLLSSGVPVLGSGLFQVIALRADRLVVGLALTTTSLGVYSIAATAAEAPRILLLAVTQILSNRIATGQVGRSSYLPVFCRIAVAYVACLIAVALVVPKILVPVVGSGFSDASRYVLTLVAAELLLGLHLMVMSALTGLAHFRNLPAPSAAGALVLVVGCVILVPSGGAMTAAVVRVVAFGVMAVVSSASLYRQLQRLGE